jgi:hypothetical protein
MGDHTDDIAASKQLQGKTNFISWLRAFERAAKAKDVLKILTGAEEVVKFEPTMEDNIVVVVDSNPNLAAQRVTRSRVPITPMTGDDDDTAGERTDTTRSMLKWQAAVKKYDRSQEKSRIAMDLLLKWVSPGVAIDLEDLDDPKEAWDLIQKRYKVSNDRVREMTLEKIVNLKLSESDSMIDYLNSHRQFAQDLKKAEHVYTNSQLATNILFGLTTNYSTFKTQYEWARALQPDESPDLDFLYDRLLNEEENKKQTAERRAKESKAKDKEMKDPKPKSSRKDNGGKDKASLVCAYAKCGRTGHDESDCWIKNPEKKPKSLKEKDEKRMAAKDKKNKDQVHLAKADVDEFSKAFKEASLTDNRSGESHAASPQHIPTPSSPADMSQTPSKSQNRRHVQQGEVVGGARAEARVQAAGVTDRGVNGLNISPQALAAFLGEVPHRKLDDAWLADCGATIHLVNDMKWFKPKTFVPLNLDVNTADGGGSLNIKGGGVIELSLLNQRGMVTVLTLPEVAYAPSGRCNLLSLSRLGQQDLRGGWDKHKLTIKQASSQIGFARVSGGLYYLALGLWPLSTPLSTPPMTSKEDVAGTGEQTQDLVASIDLDDPVWKWHRRLGHVSFSTLRLLLKQSTGIELTDKQVQAKLSTICPICATSRALVRVPREPAKRRATEAGEKMHADTWGPYPIKGYDDTSFFLFITDEKTRFTWGERFAEKHQLPQVFRRLHKHIEKSHNIEIRNYRFDNEFKEGPIGDWLEAKGIGLEPTVPYAHHMNGTAERVHRDIREKAASVVQEQRLSAHILQQLSGKSAEMLRESSIPENLWPEAMQHATWLKTRLPTRALKNKKTPWETLYGHKPAFDRERV